MHGLTGGLDWVGYFSVSRFLGDYWLLLEEGTIEVIYGFAVGGTVRGVLEHALVHGAGWVNFLDEVYVFLVYCAHFVLLASERLFPSFVALLVDPFLVELFPILLHNRSIWLHEIGPAFADGHALWEVAGVDNCGVLLAEALYETVPVLAISFIQTRSCWLLYFRHFFVWL